MVGGNCDVDDGPVGKARCQKDALKSRHVRAWPKRWTFTLEFAFCDAASEFDKFDEYSSYIDLVTKYTRLMLVSSVHNGLQISYQMGLLSTWR